MPERMSRLPVRKLEPKPALIRAFCEPKATPSMAIPKLIHRMAFISSFKKTTASKADTTGRKRLMVEPLLAVDCLVPMVRHLRRELAKQGQQSEYAEVVLLSFGVPLPPLTRKAP